MEIEDGVCAHYEFMQCTKHESHQERQMSGQIGKTEKQVLYLWKWKFIAVVVLIVLFWKSLIDVKSQDNTAFQEERTHTHTHKTNCLMTV